MADNVSITPGSGVVISADDVSGVLFQRFKLDLGGDGVSKPAIQGGSDGLPVDVLSGPATGLITKPLAGQVWPINDNGGAISIDDNAGSLTVDAPVGTPVFVRLSDGTNPIATLPVSGTVGATQGTAAAAAGAWFMKLTDGTSTVGVTDVAGAKAIKVDVIQSVTAASSKADSSTFTAASTTVVPIAAVYDDSVAAPTAGQLAGLRMTGNRALQVNLRTAAGAEIGISAAPVRTDPTGTTAQPIKLKDATGNAYSDANPLPTIPSALGRTRVTKSLALTASQTGTTIWTPTSGKQFFITDVEILISVTGALTLFDGTNAAANIVVDGITGAWTVGRHSFHYESWPWASSAVNNVLKYTSGTGLAAILTVHGFEV